MAILFIDLDRFKPVNDELGHEVRDRILIESAKRMRGVLRRVDCLARYGGDEFVVLLEDVGSAVNALQIGEKLLEAIREPFIMDSEAIGIGASIGIVLYPHHGKEAAQILGMADRALYDAKRTRGCAVLFGENAG